MYTPVTNRTSRGFTLIEMMVVVAIIAILAAMTIAGVQMIRARAKVVDGAVGAVSTAQLAQGMAMSTGDRHAVLFAMNNAGGGYMQVIRDRERLMIPCLQANPAWPQTGDF